MTCYACSTGREAGGNWQGGLAVALFVSVVAAGTAAAQDAGKIALDATYLDAPTEWCPATAGVPAVVTMDGPDIISGPTDFPKTVRERRGGSVRVLSGENIGAFNRPESMAGPAAEVIGRFSAEFQTCFSPWGTPLATGTWRFSGNDGSENASGAFENESLFSVYSPFFRPVAGSSSAHYAQFGDRRFFTADLPEITITQSFLAEPDKE